MDKHGGGDKPITVGIIGVGQIGKKHANVFAGLGGGVKLVGVADIDGKKAAQVAEPLKTRPLTDYRDLLALKPVLTVIATPHHLHREQGEAAAMAGSHVLMEKPMAHTMEDARAFVDLCRKEGVKLKVGFAHRYRQEFQLAHQLISSGEIGVPGMLVDIFGSPGGRFIPDWVWQKRFSGGGIVTYSGIHSIDWQCWLMDSEVTEVYAQSLSRYQGSDVEDAFIGTMRFANGGIGSLVGNQPDYPVEPRTRNTEIYGSKACIKMRMGEFLMFSSQGRSYQVNVTRDDPFTAQALDMVSAIREDRQPWIGAYEGLRAQAILDALYRSAEIRKPVRVESVF